MVPRTVVAQPPGSPCGSTAEVGTHKSTTEPPREHADSHHRVCRSIGYTSRHRAGFAFGRVSDVWSDKRPDTAGFGYPRRLSLQDRQSPNRLVLHDRARPWSQRPDDRIEVTIVA